VSKEAVARSKEILYKLKDIWSNTL
jgi:hypothetical protein